MKRYVGHGEKPTVRLTMVKLKIYYSGFLSRQKAWNAHVGSPVRDGYRLPLVCLIYENDKQAGWI